MEFFNEKIKELKQGKVVLPPPFGSDGDGVKPEVLLVGGLVLGRWRQWFCLLIRVGCGVWAGFGPFLGQAWSIC